MWSGDANIDVPPLQKKFLLVVWICANGTVVLPVAFSSKSNNVGYSALSRLISNWDGVR